MRVIDFDGIGNLCLFLQVRVNVGDKRFLDNLMLSPPPCHGYVNAVVQADELEYT